MEEKTLLRVRFLRDKRKNGVISADEKKELDDLEAGLIKSPVCRDLSEEYTVFEMSTLFN